MLLHNIIHDSFIDSALVIVPVWVSLLTGAIERRVQASCIKRCQAALVPGGCHKAVAVVPVHGVRGGDGLDFGAAALLDAALAVVGHVVEGQAGSSGSTRFQTLSKARMAVCVTVVTPIRCRASPCEAGTSTKRSIQVYRIGVQRGCGAGVAGDTALRSLQPRGVDGFGSIHTQLRIRATGNRMVDGFLRRRHV